VNKHCLIVVDMQNDFIDGALGFEGAQSVIPHIEHKIKNARDLGHSVYFTMDTHDQAYLSKEEGKHLPVTHCVKGTKGHSLHPSIEALRHKSDRVFIKHTFPSLDLGKTLEKEGFDSIELVGLVSNICVISNAIIAKAALPEARITVDVLATNGPDKTLHNKALDILENLHVQIKNRS